MTDTQTAASLYRIRQSQRSVQQEPPNACHNEQSVPLDVAFSLRKESQNNYSCTESLGDYTSREVAIAPQDNTSKSIQWSPNPKGDKHLAVRVPKGIASGGCSADDPWNSTSFSLKPNMANTAATQHLYAANRSIRLFVASLGNPAPYQNTRHSAGHVLLQALQAHLGLPTIARSKSHGGHMSFGVTVGKPEWTLYRSSSMMNASGPPILKAYSEFKRQEDTTATQNHSIKGLVILHDELEAEPGTIKIRRGFTSARGHNGIKSVQQSLQSAKISPMPNQNKSQAKDKLPTSGLSDAGQWFVKLGIGIGRPEGKTRETKDVSAYVLAQLTQDECSKIEALAPRVALILESEMDRLRLLT